MNWQPIETAPKDGDKIDLYDPIYGRFIDVEWCHSSPLHPDGHWVKDVLDYSGTDLSWLEPTHWMPLPTPPTDEGET